MANTGATKRGFESIDYADEWPVREKRQRLVDDDHDSKREKGDDPFSLLDLPEELLDMILQQNFAADHGTPSPTHPLGDRDLLALASVDQRLARVTGPLRTAAKKKRVGMHHLGPLLDYLGCLVLSRQCEAFGIDLVDQCDTLTLSVCREHDRFALSYTLRGNQAEIGVIVSTVLSGTARRTRDGPEDLFPSSDQRPCVRTNGVVRLSSDVSTVETVHERWHRILADDVGKHGCFGRSRLWVRMSGPARGHDAVLLMEAFGIIAAGTRLWRHPGALAIVDVPFRDVWRRWRGQPRIVSRAVDHARRLMAQSPV